MSTKFFNEIRIERINGETIFSTNTIDHVPRRDDLIDFAGKTYKVAKVRFYYDLQIIKVMVLGGYNY